MDSFGRVPHLRLWIRWLTTGTGVCVIALAASGLYLTTAEGQSFVHGPSRAPTAIVEVRYPVFGWVLQAARQNFEHFVHYARHIPEVCWEGNQVNEFQVRQCQDFWYRLSASGVFVMGPLLLGLLVLLGLRSSVGGFYFQARRKVAARRALYSGTVVDTKQLNLKSSRDFFAYLYGLTPVVVQLKNRDLKRVYLGPDSTAPEPGQTLAVFQGGRVWGADRPVAIAFNPQVVTVTMS